MEYQEIGIALFYKYRNCLTVLERTTVLEINMSPGFPLPVHYADRLAIWTLRRELQMEYMLFMIDQIYVY